MHPIWGTQNSMGIWQLWENSSSYHLLSDLLVPDNKPEVQTNVKVRLKMGIKVTKHCAAIKCAKNIEITQVTPNWRKWAYESREHEWIAQEYLTHWKYSELKSMLVQKTGGRMRGH